MHKQTLPCSISWPYWSQGTFLFTVPPYLEQPLGITAKECELRIPVSINRHLAVKNWLLESRRQNFLFLVPTLFLLVTCFLAAGFCSVVTVIHLPGH